MSFYLLFKAFFTNILFTFLILVPGGMDQFFVVECHWLDLSHNVKFNVGLSVYLTIIPRERVGYERETSEYCSRVRLLISIFFLTSFSLLDFIVVFGFFPIFFPRLLIPVLGEWRWNPQAVPFLSVSCQSSGPDCHFCFFFRDIFCCLYIID